MLKKKALNKIWITTLILFIVFAVYIVPTKMNQDQALEPNINVQYSKTSYRNIYLLNEFEQFVKTGVLLEKQDDILNNIKISLESLIVSRNMLIPDGLVPIIPKGTKVLNVSMDKDIVTVVFSSSILNIKPDYQELLIEAISYTIFEFNEVEGVSIYVDDKNINEIFKVNIPSIINRSYGINKRYEVSRLDDIQRVVIYYVDEINEKKYYVPITKYVNKKTDKIKIIIDELSGNYVYEPNLISYLNKSVILTNYEILNDKIVLSFNNSIFMNNSTILEEVLYALSYSIFDNYDVKEVIFQVDGNNFVKKVIKEVE